MENYEYLELISVSKKSEILKVRSLTDNHVYIMKIFLENKNQAITEISMMMKMQIDFVVSIKQFFEDEDGRMVAILEYCDQADLNKFVQIHMGNAISESVICRQLQQLLYILLYMHNNNFMHRALIPENILITSKSQGEEIRLTDFGNSGFGQSNHITIPAAFMPPEYLFRGEFTQKSQIWQLGILLYFMVSSKNLFQPTDTEEKIKNIHLKGNYHLKIPSKYSSQLKKVIQICLSSNDNERPTVKQLIRRQEIQQILQRGDYRFSYDQNNLFTQWQKPSAEELKRHFSTVLPDKAPFDFFSNQKQDDNMATQPLGKSDHKLTPIKYRPHKINNYTRSVQQLEQSIPLSPEVEQQAQMFMTKRLIKTPSNIRIGTSNPRKRNKFYLDHQAFQRKNVQAPTPDSSVPEEVKDKMLTLANKKYDLCVEQLGVQQTETLIKLIKNQQSIDSQGYSSVIHKYQKSNQLLQADRIYHVAQHAYDLVKLEDDFKTLSLKRK